jgi:restriction system protein
VKFSPRRFACATCIRKFVFLEVPLILLKKMGYGDFIETSKSRDGGIDGIINEDQLGLEKIYIQAKRYAENKVREADIRNFLALLKNEWVTLHEG